MLVKEICKRCYNKNRVRLWDEYRKTDKKTGKVFVQKDRTWDRGIMFCVAIMDGHAPDRSRMKCQIEVAGKPPGCCLYLVEQLMKAAELQKVQNPDLFVQ